MRIFTKRYSIEELDVPAAQGRVNCLNSIGCFIHPPFLFRRRDYGYKAYSPSINLSKKFSITDDVLHHLFCTISLAHKHGVIHGDLNDKNVLWDLDNKRVAIVDWEPLLVRSKGNSVELRATGYCIDPTDLLNHTVTKKTDILCLTRFLIRNMIDDEECDFLYSYDFREAFSKILSDYEEPESIFEDRTYLFDRYRGLCV